VDGQEGRAPDALFDDLEGGSRGTVLRLAGAEREIGEVVRRTYGSSSRRATSKRPARSWPTIGRLDEPGRVAPQTWS
jgi:hypothetical protein